MFTFANAIASLHSTLDLTDTPLCRLYTVNSGRIQSICTRLVDTFTVEYLAIRRSFTVAQQTRQHNPTMTIDTHRLPAINASSLSRRLLLLLLTLHCLLSSTVVSAAGIDHYTAGKAAFEQGHYEAAATDLWKAVLLHAEDPSAYNVQQVFSDFLQCYVLQDRLADGLAFVAVESFRRNQVEMGRKYLGEALQVDPNNALALEIQQEYAADTIKTAATKSAMQDTRNDDIKSMSPETLYEKASLEFSNKHYEECADLFEISCEKSHYQLGPSCANAVYCRSMICDWGFNGTAFDSDMLRITKLTRQETREYRITLPNDGWTWRRATSVHPHMMLGYPVESMLKRYVTESVATLDEPMARAAQAQSNNLPPLPDYLPYKPHEMRDEYIDEFRNETAKVRVGFVGSGFNSKAVLFLSQDMFRFFDTTRFEIHVFSFGPPDNPLFIKHGMRGVDWRERVKANVDYFHDCQSMKMDHVKAARFIHKHNIHILIEWDGYARQGERAQGLFALRPAPIQILHQEYLGTSGAQYVDYLFTDMITSPPHLQDLYTEKLIYLPNHFFSKGHAYHAEVQEPSYEYARKEKNEYQLGRGSPQENRCLSPKNVGPKDVSFVFCNFNKFLKNNPETMRSWIRILRETPDSILCLLENPTAGMVYLRRFVHEAAGSTDKSGKFVPGDGDDLNDRIHFLPWSNNPFDHQRRNQDFCNLMLDSYPYNGHTVAQDALYAGVPIVTRSDGQDMSSRVSTSANIVLGLEELNAYEGVGEYERIATELAKNSSHFASVRTRLINTALQRNPMHPYWDVARYVKNFESALRTVWERFLKDEPLDHVVVQETELATRGTFDDEIERHPAHGRSKAKAERQSDEVVSSVS
jgi:protein O-GlcNAc transferase